MLLKKINDMGIDVIVTQSHHTKSRYLDIQINRRNLIVRISDHPAAQGRKKFTFDIHTDKKRKGSIDYIELLDAMRIIIAKENRA
jgi:hypothetical protein